MSYEQTTLIARRGYGDMGADSGCVTGQEFDANCTPKTGGQKGQCVPAGTAGKNPACNYPSTGGVWDFLKGLASGAVGIYGQSKYSQGQSAAYQGMQPQQSGTPSWVVPVAIGAVGLTAVVLLTRKRKNPARRRRHSRRRR